MNVTLLMAMTADGKIAKNDAHFTDWTDREDKRLFKSITRAAGVFIMGRKTFETFPHPLPGCLNVVMTRNAAQKPPADNVLFSSQRPRELIKDLEERGFQQVVIAGGATINTLFAAENLIDEMVLTYSPRIFGAGISLFSAPMDLSLALKDLKKMGNGLVYVRYTVRRPA